MNLRRPMRTDSDLWLVCAVVAFTLLGFVHLHTRAVEGKVGPSHFWGVVVHAPQVMELGEAIVAIVIYTAILAAPATVFGWVAQAIIVAIRSGKQDTAGNPSPTSN